MLLPLIKVVAKRVDEYGGCQLDNFILEGPEQRTDLSFILCFWPIFSMNLAHVLSVVNKVEVVTTLLLVF